MMQKIKRGLVALLCLVLAIPVLLFTIENKQAVELGFLGYSSPQIPLAVVCMLAFIVGALLTALIFWWPLSRHKGKNKRLQRKVKRLESLLEKAEDHIEKQAKPTQELVTAE